MKSPEAMVEWVFIAHVISVVADEEEEEEGREGGISVAGHSVEYLRSLTFLW